MTGPEPAREAHLRAIVSLGQTELETADDLVRQAAKRLDIILRSPSELLTPARSMSEMRSDGYPFSAMSDRIKRKTQTSHTHHLSRNSCRLPQNRHCSRASATSILSTGILPTPVKSSASSTSLAAEQASPDRLHTSSPPRDTATSSLRRVQARAVVEDPTARDEPVWPSIRQWSVRRSTPRAEDTFADPPSTSSLLRTPILIEADPHPQLESSTKSDDTLTPLLSDRNAKSPIIRPNASSPNLRLKPEITSLRSQQSSSSLLLRNAQSNIAPIDPSLAAAELASALTKHVTCSVCSAKGVNFPECRRCGMRFCSRGCRVGEKGAGDGKR